MGIRSIVTMMLGSALCLGPTVIPVQADALEARAAAPAPALTKLDVGVRFRTNSGREAPEKYTRGRHIFEFHAGRGVFLPAQLKGVFVDDIVTGESRLTLPLDEWAGFSRLAGPLTIEVRKLGFRMTPDDAQLSVMRARTFFMSGSKMGRSTVLMDEEGNTYVLAWFDRPCHLEGTGRDGDRELTADVRIETPGFHLLSYTQGRDGRYRIVAAPSVPTLYLTTLFDY